MLPSLARARITPVRPEALVLALRRATVALCAVSVLLFIVMNVLEFFYFQRLSGGLPSLDIRISGFTTEDAVGWLTALGEPGREAVLVWQYSSFDLFFPALFGLALAGLFLHASSRPQLFAPLSRLAQLSLSIAVALPYVVADYAQNFLIARMLSDPSSATVWMTSVASRLVIAKCLLAIAAMLIVAAVFLRRRGRA